MAESASHIYLVEQLVLNISKTYDISSSLAYIDHPESKFKPNKINGYIPDYYYYDSNESFIIIGEAKTANDVDNKHTVNQIIAYLKKCTEYDCSFFIFAVPWQLVNFSKCMIRKICKDNEIEVKYKVLDSLRDIK